MKRSAIFLGLLTVAAAASAQSSAGAEMKKLGKELGITIYYNRSIKDPQMKIFREFYEKSFTQDAAARQQNLDQARRALGDQITSQKQINFHLMLRLTNGTAYGEFAQVMLDQIPNSSAFRDRDIGKFLTAEQAQDFLDPPKGSLVTYHVSSAVAWQAGDTGIIPALSLSLLTKIGVTDDDRAHLAKMRNDFTKAAEANPNPKSRIRQGNETRAKGIQIILDAFPAPIAPASDLRL